ncbi:MAG: 2-phospho-L-lactate guanylyltransferase [Candidatus Helarchaeota archaeon]
MHYTIIPIKSLSNSKKRLESFLSPIQRRQLVLALLKDVLTAVANSKFSNGTLIVTPDSEIVEIIQGWNFSNNIEYLLEHEAKGTNHAVQQAIDWCSSKPISSILIIPADLPLITSKDIDELLKLGNQHYPLIIAPSQRKDGTNAFYQRPPNLVQVWYGNNSFQKNLQLIMQSQVPYKIFENPAFALDIDLKEDLQKLFQLKEKSASFKFITSLKFNFLYSEKKIRI